MANPSKPDDLEERRKLLELLDRLDTVQPGRECLPDVIVGQWLHGDPGTRRTIEDAINRLPKRKKSS